MTQSATKLFSCRPVFPRMPCSQIKHQCREMKRPQKGLNHPEITTDTDRKSKGKQQRKFPVRGNKELSL